MTERVLLYSVKSRRPILVVIGEGGAASVEVNVHDGEGWGVIDFHSRMMRQEREPEPCWLAGTCHPMCPAFSGGFEVADLWERGMETSAWAVLESWYVSQLGGFYID